MNRFKKADLRKRIFSSFTISLVIFIAVIVVFVVGVASVSNSSVVNDRQILSDAIERDIIHCYCVEGMYPPSVKYMQEHYGLTFNEDKYIVDYEYVGANIMPQYTIILRSGK